MATVDRAITILLVAGISLLLLYAERGSRQLAVIASSAKQDACVTGADSDVRRSFTYSDYGNKFFSKTCSGTAAVWQIQGGRLTLRSVQAFEPATWLPDEINIYAPAENLLTYLGRPHMIDRGRRLDIYHYKPRIHQRIVVQVFPEKGVIGSVSVEFQEAMPNNSFKPSPLRGLGRAP